MFAIHSKTTSNEYSTAKESLNSGYRPDLRSHIESRKMNIQTSSQPGFCTVTLGNTIVHAISTAQLRTPNSESPNRGFHSISIRTTIPSIQNFQLTELENYIYYIWRKCDLIEEGSLCVKPGEKVWSIETVVQITSDDGGIPDTILTSIFISLSTLNFPAFDSSSGILLNPSNHRPHRIASTFTPTIVSVSFINTGFEFFTYSTFASSIFDAKMPNNTISEPKDLPQKDIHFLVDPTRIELDLSSGFGVFIFDDSMRTEFADVLMPGDFLKEAKSAAIEIAKQRKEIIKAAIHSHPIGINTVGSLSNYEDFEVNKVNSISDGVKLEAEPFEIWKEKIGAPIVLSTFSLNHSTKSSDENTQETTSDNWLFSSIIA